MKTTAKPSQPARLRRACVSGITALALLTVAAGPAAACDKGAVKTVETMYKTYLGDEIFNQTAPEIYSPRLQPIVKAWNTRCEANMELDGCVLDGDFFIDGNDFKISKLKVTCLSGDDAKSRVMVKFRNFDTPSTKVFDMVKNGDRWLIDEIADGTDGKGFLGEIFKAP
jgi:hypothetical protein